jgi:hypothetical protein
MVFVLFSQLFIIAAAAAATTSTSISAPLSTAASATFPEHGTELGITGTLQFTKVSKGVQITSPNIGLYNFPIGEGPFLYHSSSPFLNVINNSSC